MGVGQLRWHCYRRHQQTHNRALTEWFSRRGKKVECAKSRTKRRGMSYGKIGLTTMAVTLDLLSGMPLGSLNKITHPPFEQFIT